MHPESSSSRVIVHVPLFIDSLALLYSLAFMVNVVDHNTESTWYLVTELAARSKPKLHVVIVCPTRSRNQYYLGSRANLKGLGNINGTINSVQLASEVRTYLAIERQALSLPARIVDILPIKSLQQACQLQRLGSKVPNKDHILPSARSRGE
jgi:hypothetical protein